MMTKQQRSWVVVTGSSSGIGKAIAVATARCGWNVVVHGFRNVDGVQQTASLVRDAGVSAETILANLDLENDRLRLVETVFAMGRVGAWINNAGVDVLTGDEQSLPFDEKLDLLWRVDVRGTILLSRLVARQLIEQSANDSASIAPPSMVFIGWDQAPKGMEGEAGQMFCPIKSAVMGYAKALAQDLAPRIRVNCIAPGWIRTSWGESTDEYWNRRATESSLMQRWGTPEDIANAATFLIAEESGFITGQTLEINGGWSNKSKRVSQ